MACQEIKISEENIFIYSWCMIFKRMTSDNSCWNELENISDIQVDKIENNFMTNHYVVIKTSQVNC